MILRIRASRSATFLAVGCLVNAVHAQDKRPVPTSTPAQLAERMSAKSNRTFLPLAIPLAAMNEAFSCS